MRILNQTIFANSMPLHISMQLNGEYLLLEVSGRYNLDDFLEMIRISKKECDKHKVDRLLVDLRRLESEQGVSVMDRYVQGEEAAKVYSYKIKVAVIGSIKKRLSLVS